MAIIEKVKVYSDGSHYIGIKKKGRPAKKKSKVNENIVIVNNEPVDLKEKYNELSKKYSDKKKSVKKAEIEKEMRKFFKSEKSTKKFVENNMERELRNKIVRKTRLSRKLNNQEFNYFCTFTYDSSKFTEEGFKKSFSNCLKHLVKRKGYKYVGVWERSPENNRLHFHGIFYIPEGQMIGELFEKKDFDTKSKKMQTTIQNTHFNKRFGRSDFKELFDKEDVRRSLKYISKYLEKSGEKLVFSKNIPAYFIVDILEEDIICPYGEDESKFILQDKFLCIQDGVVLGTVSKEIISQLPKCN